MEHTKEPWCVGQGIDADLILDADGNLICANYVSAEMARRIVACVNVCEGIDIDGIEYFSKSGGLARILEEKTLFSKLAAKYEKQIDELRTVCAEAYQFAGEADAPVEVMDNLYAAAAGEILPHETFVCATSPLRKQRDELLEALISAVEDEPNACFAEHARSVIAKLSGQTK